MTTLVETSLATEERALVDRFVERLRTLLSDEWSGMSPRSDEFLAAARRRFLAAIEALLN
jgi:hypothetical protein